MSKVRTLLIFALAVGLAGQAIYVAGAGVWNPLIHRPAILAVGALVVVLVLPLDGGRLDSPFLRFLSSAADIAMASAVTLACYRYVTFREVMEEGIFSISVADQLLTLAAIISILELTRRAFGLPLPIFAGLALVYTLFGRQLPDLIRHAGYSLETTMESVWFTTTGVFGLPMSVLIQLILVFIVFGVLLESTGAGGILLRIAFSLTARMRGGPANAAIVSSAVFGTMSGATVANVVGTGTFTIPMIIRRGFTRQFAGAVEAGASAGGQIMPPIMGAAAFYMSQLTGVPYFTIALAALAPAIFYYAALFLAVSFESGRRDIQPIPESERPKLTLRDWLMSATFLGPIAVIVIVLLAGRSPALAGFFAVLSVCILGVLNPDLRRNPWLLVTGLRDAGIAASKMVVLVGTLGIIIAVVDLTGTGIQFAQLVLEIGSESLIAALLLTMLASIVLGMGMPTLPAYLIIVIIMGPAIARLGVDVLQIHLFVFYFGVLSDLTPPVAIAAYAAAPIAQANPVHTALVAVRLSAVGFILPFVFVYEPSLLLVTEDFTLVGFVSIMLRLGLAVWLLTSGFFGFEKSRLNSVERLLRIVIAALCFVPIVPMQWIAFAVGAVLVFRHRYLPASTESLAKESGAQSREM